MTKTDPDPSSAPNAPRWLYAHGFASGPESSKGRALSLHYADKSIAIQRLNLRVPTFEQQRLSAMIRAVREAIGSDRDRAIVFGSSLGGLTAARAAEEDPRICALVLMAPAFRIMERWRVNIGEERWHDWETSGWYATEDYAEKKPSRVDFGFVEDAIDVEDRGDGWPDVRVPTLIVHGVKDSVVSIETSRKWAQSKRHVRLVEVDDGHELTNSIEVIKRESDRFLAGFGV